MVKVMVRVRISCRKDEGFLIYTGMSKIILGYIGVTK